MPITTLSFETECKHCKTQTVFTALSIPEGLPEEQINGILKDRELDCCYTCYELYEHKDPTRIVIP